MVQNDLLILTGSWRALSIEPSVDSPWRIWRRIWPWLILHFWSLIMANQKWIRLSHIYIYINSSSFVFVLFTVDIATLGQGDLAFRDMVCDIGHGIDDRLCDFSGWWSNKNTLQIADVGKHLNVQGTPSFGKRTWFCSSVDIQIYNQF